MSWNLFNRYSAPKKSVVSRSEQREFERQVKKLEELDEGSRKLYKDMKRCIEANAALSKSERKITQDLCVSQLGQQQEGWRRKVDEWDHALTKLEMQMHELNSISQKTVVEPMRKFNGIFPSIQTAVKRREQSLQEYNRCHTKLEKYKELDRTGRNALKLDAGKKAFDSAKKDFTLQNSSLREDMPKLYDSRIEYFQPCLEALIKAQVAFNTDAFKTHTELSSEFSDHRKSMDKHSKDIDKTLSEIRALSITVDD